MVNAIIIDDERNALDVLKYQITHYCTGVQVIGESCDPNEGIKLINECCPQLVFIDIEMPNKNGFDVLNATAHNNYKVIFTTAYDQFAIKAFKYSAIDYLLKPIDIEELKAAVKRVEMHREDLLSFKVEKLFENLKIEKKKKITLPHNDGYIVVDFSEIIRCESDSNYTIVYMTGNRKSVLSKTLKDVEEILQHHSFFRIHHSHLINIDHIKRLYKTDGGSVTMVDNATLSISRSKKDEFFKIVIG